MDRDLPFSFLDHKIKCGNSLVGAWFDTFQHYPVMAWKNREGGDKAHTNGVHFQKEARTKAIKAFVRDTLTPDLQTFLRGRTLFHEDLQERASAQTHADALAVLSRLHDLPVHAAGDRARVYRDEVEGSPEYHALKHVMDLWCACWFWPVKDIAHAPLPTTLVAPLGDTVEAGVSLAARKRFFHWELEFPDVFNTERSGFDAILGNPPWDIAKPNSKEFFSNIDPLYRAYGKQEAIGRQTVYFADSDVEERWLDYNSDFRAQSNLVGYAGYPFGDPSLVEKPEDKFSIVKGRVKNLNAHDRWRSARARSRGFADAAHSFRHQGGADLNLYKLFLEQAHALLRPAGRLGFIAPSGLYSDQGTGDLRRLFLDRCRWEWLFGFENRDQIFDIHRSFKFNPVVVQKGGETRAIRTAFMRRRLEDWESAEAFATPYTRERVERFSPISKAVLEIESQRDLDILEQIYKNSVLLGDSSSDGWRFDYGRELEMTSDSKLFPPLERWQSRGFVRTAYGTWINSDSHEAEPLFEGRMIGQFDCCAARWIRGKGRSAEWEDLPLDRKDFGPQFLMSADDVFANSQIRKRTKIAIMRVSSATNSRTTIATIIPRFPSQHSLFTGTASDSSGIANLALTGVLNSFVFDYVVRQKCAGVNVTASVLNESPCPTRSRIEDLLGYRYWVASIAKLVWVHPIFSPDWMKLTEVMQTELVAKNVHRRALRYSEYLRLRCVIDAVAASYFGLDEPAFRWILRDCTYPLGILGDAISRSGLAAHAFWRVDKDKDPELRHTVLTLIAFQDLDGKVRAAGGDHAEGVRAFFEQNSGEGWMLPETLTLADYGLGHDERAKHPQPVASRLGPRFYDWQLAQTPEESWRECEIHAKSLQAAGMFSSEAVLPADTGVVNERSVPPRGKRRRQDEKGLFAIDGQEDDPA